MSETKVNSLFLDKIKTIINKGDSVPDITGKTLGEFHAEQRIALHSGEADIYLCSGTGSIAGGRFVLKYYRRKDAVKPEVLEKIRGLINPCVSPVAGYGEYEGHQYEARPYYEMPALSEVLAQGATFSEEELKGLVIPSVITGLKALHDAGILHKDLKPANLIPDDSGEHIVIIDFGISSAAGKNTFVVTQTGMTLAYAAPEAMQGIFHKETDYYALGITVFELFTGFTPFQNPGLSPEEAARLASISKIEFPKNFPEDLKKLVLGLTYKDISHRNEKDNPNRRWGYDEVRRWLNGEEVPVPGENSNAIQNHNFLPYSFDGVKHTNIEELVKALLKKPEAGIREVGRGILAHHFGLFDDRLGEKCKKAEESFLKNTDPVSVRKVFYHLMYDLAPNLKSLFCGGMEYNTIQELGNAAIDAAISEDLVFCEELSLLQRSFLEEYAADIIKRNPVSNVLQILNKLADQKQYTNIRLSWIIGYAFSEKRELKVHGKVFSTTSNLVNYFHKIEKDKGFSAYASYIEECRDDLEFFASCYPDSIARRDIIGILDDLNRAVFGDGKLHFKNSKEFDDYIGKLLKEKNTYGILQLFKTYDVALNEISTKIWKSSSYDKVKNIVSNFVEFDEYLFATEYDLKSYLENLVKEHEDTPVFFINYVKCHGKTLTKFGKNPIFSDLVNKIQSYGDSNSLQHDNIVINGVSYPTVYNQRLISSLLGANDRTGTGNNSKSSKINRSRNCNQRLIDSLCHGNK